MTLREVAPGESCGSDCCALFSQAVESRSEFFCAGQQRFYERGPFGVQGGAPKVAAGAVVPVIGIRGGPFFPVKIGMDRHAVGRFQPVNQAMRFIPIAFGIPPECGERSEKVCAWRPFGERSCEFFEVHVCALLFPRPRELRQECEGLRSAVGKQHFSKAREDLHSPDSFHKRRKSRRRHTGLGNADARAARERGP
jgi:hypothetical protein